MTATPATRVLERAGIAFREHAFAHDPRADHYGREAADALGIEPDRVFKTLVVQADDELIVAVVPVSARLDQRALATAAGRKRAALADPRVAERRTGYVLGGISPLGQRTRLRTFIDASAADRATILVSGGRRGLDLELVPADLVAATDAVVARLV